MQITYTVTFTFTFAYYFVKWEFRPCGAGFIIGSVVRSSLFLAVRDSNVLGPHLEGAAGVVTETLPTCWEVELMHNGNKNAEGGAEDDEKGEVYVR